ncbi:MAG: ribonuclease HI [Treponema sp.]|nr:ribonuclease HI [Treponema sp.]
MTLREQAQSLLEKIPDESLESAIESLKKLAENKVDKSSESKNVQPKTANSDGSIVIYTDGGCHGNPGPGGWGIVVIADGEARSLSGGEKITTNNRMELLAAINALSVFANTPSFCGRKIVLNTDSKYVKNGITSWISGWKKNGWKTSKKTDVLNRDLWETLDNLNESVKPEWSWVKGHAGIEYNEKCDQLCQEEIAKFE